MIKKQGFSVTFTA